MMPGRNGGRLLRGGHAGPGRPRKAVRDMLLHEFVEQIPKLKREIGKKGKITRKEYADLCAKYGLGTTITETDAEGNDVIPFTFRIDSPGDDGTN
jgi:hypothetical protein